MEHVAPNQLIVMMIGGFIFEWIPFAHYLVAC